jgi:hypothetical protein
MPCAGGPYPTNTAPIRSPARHAHPESPWIGYNWIDLDIYRHFVAALTIITVDGPIRGSRLNTSATNPQSFSNFPSTAR